MSYRYIFFQIEVGFQYLINNFVFDSWNLYLLIFLGVVNCCEQFHKEGEGEILSAGVSGGKLGREMQSASIEQVQSVADTRGKHRISAELKRLEQEARFLEEELEQLEKTEKASAACKEMLINVETRPDPLLPTTNGPGNPSWDRWFEGPQEKSGCRCWIL